ncbi:MAG: hypothetical protein ACLR8Y_16990 [Alistipes indistinctus]
MFAACTPEIIPAIRMMASSKEGLKTLKGHQQRVDLLFHRV